MRLWRLWPALMLSAQAFHWPSEQIGERSGERVRAGKRAAKFIACSVCEQVVQSSFPKPHELDSIRKTFSSEDGILATKGS
eukprot:g9247.t1